MATHSSIIAWKILRTEEPGEVTKELDMTERARTHTHTHTHTETHTHTPLGWLPRWLSSKESACQAGGTGLIPGLRRPPGEGNGNPLQNFAWEIP